VQQGRELTGKVALVTGASRNIGRAIALDLAAGGAAVVVNTRTSREAAEGVAREIEAAGGAAIALSADVTDEAQVTSMIEQTVARFGRLDFLVNNAAVRPSHKLDALSLADYRSVLALILEAPFICAQAALPHLRKSGAAAIVSIGGMTGHVGATDRVHVVTGKAGLVGLTKALARELAPDRITANCVVPGVIDTQRTHMPSAHAALPSPLGRQGAPAEISGMVRYLCGPLARFITGQAIHVNGGAYMP